MFRKLPWVLLALAFFSTARCYTADLAGGLAAVPFVGPILVPGPGVPAYVEAIGTPAPVEVPGDDPAAWFPAEGGWEAITPGAWAEMALAATAGRTPAGWAELCARMTATAGSERSAAPLPGALACSDDPTVTALQRIALQLFDLRAALGLWMVGAPNGSIGAIQARQAELRLLCATAPPGRGDPAPVQRACTEALDASYLAGDGTATMTAVEAAYAAIAAVLAALDPTTDAEPATFAVPAPGQGP